MLPRVPVIVVLGATGSGKSKLAIEIAMKYAGEILSADSMQVYKGLDVITNKVTDAERRMAPHHLIDCVDPLKRYTVVDYRNQALAILADLVDRRRLPVVVGGTNYYIESLLWRVLVEDETKATGTLMYERDLLPRADEEDASPRKRPRVDEDLEAMSSQDLHRRLQDVDPEMAVRLHPNDKRKIVRSLCVLKNHGRTHSSILREQRELAGGSNLGGPLRYPHSCILWLQCEQVGFVVTAAKNHRSNPCVVIEAPPQGLEREFAELLSKEAIDFVALLVQTFDDSVTQLHWERLGRKCRHRDTSRLPVIKEVTQGWKVTPPPRRLLNRHLDLGDVSPADIDHFTRALHADVQGIQVDFDDGHCPTWRNQIIGLHNVYRAVRSQIPGVPVIAEAPVLMLRPRAWNMTEHNMMVNGKEVPGPLFDFGLLMYHNGHILAANQSGPFFYLSKVEGANEAKLWNSIFEWSERQLGISHGTVRACVLIENIFSSFELDEILFALKDHSLGLNCGIWDYAASIICKFGDNKDFILPDRNKYVSMDRHFLKSYLQLVVQTCHRRGAHATGGMAAQLVPANKNADAVIEKVCRGKLQEIKEGVDGFMVYDIALVPHINKLWQDNAPGLNQLSVVRDDVAVVGRDLLEMPSGGVTYAGLKHNISVVIQFIFHWFGGRGHYFYHGAVEDSATAEISRSQIWQWIRHEASIEDHNQTVTKALVDNLANEYVTNFSLELISIPVQRKLQIAKELFMEIVCKRDFPEFITTYLNDSHTFWSYHAKYVV